MYSTYFPNVVRYHSYKLQLVLWRGCLLLEDLGFPRSWSNRCAQVVKVTIHLTNETLILYQYVCSTCLNVYIRPPDSTRNLCICFCHSVKKSETKMIFLVLFSTRWKVLHPNNSRGEMLIFDTLITI